MRFQTVVGNAICQTAHPLIAVFGETHKIMTVPICLPEGLDAARLIAREALILARSA